MHNPDFPPRSIKSPETEFNFENFEKAMAHIAQEINAEFSGQAHGNLIDDSLRISMTAFERGKDGPYARAGEGSIKEDKRSVQEKIRNFSGIDNPDIQKFLEKKYSTQDEAEILSRWQEDQECKESGLTEKIITFILYKILKEKFLIVRTCEFDDYENGVDNLIVDRETGEVVGAFDEVFDSFNEQDVEVKRSKKWSKIVKKNQGNRNQVKYGISLDSAGKLERRALSELPVFFLSLSKHDFNELLGQINLDINSEPTQKEVEIFSNLIRSLNDQVDRLKETPGISPTVLAKLDKFKESLEKMSALSKTL